MTTAEPKKAARKPDEASEDKTTVVWNLNRRTKLVRTGHRWFLKITSETSGCRTVGAYSMRISRSQAGKILRMEGAAYAGHPFQRAVDDDDQGPPPGRFAATVTGVDAIRSQRDPHLRMRIRLDSPEVGSISAVYGLVGETRPFLIDMLASLGVRAPLIQLDMSSTREPPYRSAPPPLKRSTWLTQDLQDATDSLVGRKVRVCIKLAGSSPDGHRWRSVEITGPAPSG